MMDPKRIGEMIKARRMDLGLTQEQLGQKLGVTAQAVSKWEQGVSLPDTSLLPGICRVLSIPAAVLLGVEEEANDDRWSSYEAQIRQIRALGNVGYSGLPGALNLFALLALIMFFVFRGTSVVYFGISVGGMALIMAAWFVSKGRRE